MVFVVKTRTFDEHLFAWLLWGFSNIHCWEYNSIIIWQYTIISWQSCDNLWSICCQDFHEDFDKEVKLSLVDTEAVIFVCRTAMRTFKYSLLKICYNHMKTYDKFVKIIWPVFRTDSNSVHSSKFKLQYQQLIYLR